MPALEDFSCARFLVRCSGPHAQIGLRVGSVSSQMADLKGFFTAIAGSVLEVGGRSEGNRGENGSVSGSSEGIPRTFDSLLRNGRLLRLA